MRYFGGPIMDLLNKWLAPLPLVRAAGLIDGLSLITLLCIAMPLKYFADIPFAVTIVGSIHGAIFSFYFLAIIYAQIAIRWNVIWSIAALIVAFIPFGNFVFDRFLKKREDQFYAKPIPKRWIVYGIIFFTFIDLFTQLPVMSTFATSVGASAMIAGFVVGMYSLTNTIGNILSGILTDKHGAYVVMATGLVTTGLSLLLYNLVDNVVVLLIVRFIHGFLGGLIVPAAFTYLANITEDSKQGSQNAMTGSFVGTAAIIGPAYSGIMASRTSVPFVFTTVGLLGISLFIITLIFLRTYRVREVRPKTGDKKKLVHNRLLWLSFAGAFFLMYSQGALAYLLPLHVVELGYDSRVSGTLLSMFGIVAVLIFALPTNRIFNVVSPITTFSFGLGMMALAQFLIGQNSEQALLYGCLALYGVGFAFLFPSITLMLVRATVPETRGKGYGLFYAFFSLGVVAGSFTLGLIDQPVTNLFTITSIVLLVCVVMTILLGRRANATYHNSK